MLTYEEQRLQNIKDNESLLLSLGLVTPTRTVATAKRPALVKQASNSSTKRRLQSNQDLKDGGSPAAKVRRTPKVSTPTRGGGVDATLDGDFASGLRRSTRSSGRRSYREIDEGDMVTGSPLLKGVSGKPFEVDDGDYDDEDEAGDEEERIKQRNNKPLGVRTQNPQEEVWAYPRCGSGEVVALKGRYIGKTANVSRMGASTDAIHAPFVAGISGNASDGAWSVALSGGYPDDVDLGTAFTYTGCGGRDLKGTKNAPKNLRTAPQTFDQSFDNPMNAALKRSAETRKPIRVLRGFKLPSVYAPAEGYRYDGLYVVEKAWMAKGLTKGLMVCRYAFRRLPGQGALPVRSEEGEDVEGSEDVEEARQTKKEEIVEKIGSLERSRFAGVFA